MCLRTIPPAAIHPRRNVGLRKHLSVMSVEVRAGPHCYDALIESGLLASTGEFVKKQLHGPRCAVISDTNVAPLFGDRVKRSLASADFRATLVTTPAGEKGSTVSSRCRIGRCRSCRQWSRQNLWRNLRRTNALAALVRLEFVAAGRASAHGPASSRATQHIDRLKASLR